MQLEVVVEPICASVHGLPVNPPAPLVANITVPDGAEPFAFESATVTVQVVEWWTATEAGAQPVTVVVVERKVTVRPVPTESELFAWIESFAV